MEPSAVSEEVQLVAENQAAYCRAIGNFQRILILWLLMEREMTLDQIAMAIGASPQSASRHLNILEFNHLVKARLDQQGNVYQIAKSEQTNNCPVLKNKPIALWDEIKQTQKENTNV